MLGWPWPPRRSRPSGSPRPRCRRRRPQTLPPSGHRHSGSGSRWPLLLDTEDDGSFEQLTLHPQPSVLPLQLPQPRLLVACQPVLLATVDAVLANPVPQGRVVDAKLPGDFGDRPAAATDQLDRVAFELGSELAPVPWLSVFHADILRSREVSCLRTPLANSHRRQRRSESGEARGPAAAKWRAGEPGVDADHVERQRGQHMLQVGLGQAAVAGLVQVAAAGGLRDGPLDPGAVRVPLLPGRGDLLGAELALGLELRAGPEGEMAGVGRRAGAAGAVGTGRAVGGAEGRLHDGQPVAAGALPPVAGGLAVGAGDLLVVPVDLEPGEVKAVLVAGLPAGVGRQWADQLD